MIDGNTVVALAVIFGMVAIIMSGSQNRFRASYNGKGMHVETSPTATQPPLPRPDDAESPALGPESDGTHQRTNPGRCVH